MQCYIITDGRILKCTCINDKIYPSAFEKLKCMIVFANSFDFFNVNAEI